MSLSAAVAQQPPPQTLRGFEASTRIEVTLADVQLAAILLDQVRGAGVSQIFGPVASEETAKELTRRALEDGFDDAVEEAKRLAAKAGVALGPVMTIDERRTESPFPPLVIGPGFPYPRPSAPSDDVYATVTVTFAVS
jgi:uncharacterized protein YggE